MPDREPYMNGPMDLRCPSRDVDRIIGTLASRQHGTVGRAQLLARGVSAGAIAVRVKRRRLIVLFPGVYAVGHAALTRRGRWMAGVLSGGPGADLSGRAALALHGLRASSVVEVTAPTQRRSREGITFRHATVPADERTVVDGIPVTSAARAILDVAATASEHQVERLGHEAEVQRVGGPLSLDDLLARYPGRRGTRTVRRVLERGRAGLDVTDSELEDRFLVALERHGLPRPRCNAEVEGFRIDAVWSGQRLAVELDSRRTHATTRRFESDRARDRTLLLAGWRVVRITWRQLTEDEDQVLGDLAVLLGVRRRALAR